MKVFIQSTITILNRIQQSQKLSKNNMKCGSSREERNIRQRHSKTNKTPDIGPNIIFHDLFLSLFDLMVVFVFTSLYVYAFGISLNDKLDLEMEHLLCVDALDFVVFVVLCFDRSYNIH